MTLTDYLIAAMIVLLVTGQGLLVYGQHQLRRAERELAEVRRMLGARAKGLGDG